MLIKFAYFQWICLLLVTGVLCEGDGEASGRTSITQPKSGDTGDLAASVSGENVGADVPDTGDADTKALDEGDGVGKLGENIEESSHDGGAVLGNGRDEGGQQASAAGGTGTDGLIGDTNGDDGVGAAGDIAAPLGEADEGALIQNNGAFSDALPDLIQPVIFANDTTSEFGHRSDMSEDFIIVGDFAANGNGGMAFLYNRKTRTFIRKFVPQGGSEKFGFSVAVEGNVVVIGALGARSIYIFEEIGGDWQLINKFSSVINGDNYGQSVAINSDVSIIAVGAPYSDSNLGRVYIYERAGDAGPMNWQETYQITDWGTTGYKMGIDVDLEGDTLVTGGMAVAVHKRWKLWDIHQYNGNYYNVAISGDTIVVGNYYSTTCYIYIYDNYMSEQKSLSTYSPFSIRGLNYEYLGVSVDAAREGNLVVAGASRWDGSKGRGYVMVKVNGLYSLSVVEDPTGASNDEFGTSAAVYEDGMVIFGSPDNEDVSGDHKGSINIFSACDALNSQVWVKTADTSTGQSGCTNTDRTYYQTGHYLGAESCQTYCLGAQRTTTAIEWDNEGDSSLCTCFPSCDYARTTYDPNVDVYELQCTNAESTPEPDHRVFHDPVSKLSQPGTERPSDEQFGQKLVADDTYLYVGDYNFQNTGRVYIYDKASLAQISVIDRPDASQGTQFGFSLAISRSLLVVGAPKGDGSIFLYNEATPGNWVLEHTFVNPEAPTLIDFGYSVDVVAYSDSQQDRIFVGAPRKDTSSGGVFKYGRQIDGTWTTGVVLNAPAGHSLFGAAIGVGDGLAVVMSYGCEFTYYMNDGPAHHNTINGCSSLIDRAVSVNGQEFAVGEPRSYSYQGQVEIYKIAENGSGYVKTHTLQASDSEENSGFGWSLSFTGDYLLVGAPAKDDFTGKAYMFYRVNTHWSEETIYPTTRLTGMEFGITSAITSDGTIFVGAPLDLTPESPRNGAVYKYGACSSLYWDPISVVTPQPNDQPGCGEQEVVFQDEITDLDACQTFCMEGRTDSLFIALDLGNRCDCYGDTCTLSQYEFYSSATYYQLKCSETFDSTDPTPNPTGPSQPPTGPTPTPSNNPQDDTSGYISITFVSPPDVVQLKDDLVALLGTVYAEFTGSRLTLATFENTATVSASPGVPSSEQVLYQLDQLLQGNVSSYSSLNNIVGGSVTCDGCPTETCPTNSRLTLTETPVFDASQSGFFTKDELTLQYKIPKLYDGGFVLSWQEDSSLNYPQDPNNNYAIDTSLPCDDVLIFQGQWSVVNNVANDVAEILGDPDWYKYTISTEMTAYETISYGEGIVETNTTRPVKKAFKIPIKFPKFVTASTQVEVVGATINTEALISADAVETDPSGGILDVYEAHATLILETTVIGFYKFDAGPAITAANADLQNDDLSISMTNDTKCVLEGELCLQLWIIEVYSENLCQFSGNLDIALTMICQTATNCPLAGGQEVVNVQAKFEIDDQCFVGDVTLGAIDVTLTSYSSNAFDAAETDFVSGQTSYFQIVATSDEVSFTPSVDRLWVSVGQTDTDIVSSAGVLNDPVPSDINFGYISQAADIQFHMDLVPGFFPPTSGGTVVTVHVTLSLVGFGNKLLEMADLSVPMLLQSSDTFIEANSFFNVLPCLNDPEWSSEWGYCKDYEVDMQNHGYCDVDSGVTENKALARVACPIACGICAAGVSPTKVSPTEHCSTHENLKDWTDSLHKDCTFYEANDLCDSPFVSAAATDGVSALEACCYCGGGEPITP